MGYFVQPAGCVQQVALGGRRTKERILDLGQLSRDFRRAHPESIPEPLPRLQRKARPHGDGALCRAGEQAQRHGARARAPEQLADGDRPLNV